MCVCAHCVLIPDDNGMQFAVDSFVFALLHDGVLRCSVGVLQSAAAFLF